MLEGIAGIVAGAAILIAVAIYRDLRRQRVREQALKDLADMGQEYDQE